MRHQWFQRVDVDLEGHPEEDQIQWTSYNLDIDTDVEMFERGIRAHIDQISEDEVAERCRETLGHFDTKL